MGRKGLLYRSNSYVDFTPGQNYAAGDVIVNGRRAMVTTIPLTNGVKKRINAGGQYRLEKDASVFAVDDPVYYKFTGNPLEPGEAGTGCATSDSSGLFIGRCKLAAGADATHVVTEFETRPIEQLQQVCCAFATDLTTGDGKAYFLIERPVAGLNLIGVAASLITAGITGTTDIQIARIRAGVTVDVLSTKATIDTTELNTTTAAVPAVINAANDDAKIGDLFRVDVDAVQSGTAPKGLIVVLIFG
jgi:hypothetical protein